jgi:hypothetical protein
LRKRVLFSCGIPLTKHSHQMVLCHMQVTLQNGKRSSFLFAESSSLVDVSDVFVNSIAIPHNDQPHTVFWKTCGCICRRLHASRACASLFRPTITSDRFKSTAPQTSLVNPASPFTPHYGPYQHRMTHHSPGISPKLVREPTAAMTLPAVLHSVTLAFLERRRPCP